MTSDSELQLLSEFPATDGLVFRTSNVVIHGKKAKLMKFLKEI